MSITKSIGKNTLGGGNSMKVDLKTYNRSTHNLSYAWRRDRKSTRLNSSHSAKSRMPSSA